MTTLSGFLPVQSRQTACFSVIATSEPETMSRVLEIFAKRGLVPARWLSAVAGPRDWEIHIDISLPMRTGSLPSAWPNPCAKWSRCNRS